MLNGLEQNSLFSDLEKSRAKIQERFIRKFIFHQHASLQNALKRGRSIIIFSGEKIAFFLKISHEKMVKLKGVSLSWKQSADEAIVRHIIRVGHGESTHAEAYLFLCSVSHWKVKSITPESHHHTFPYHANHLSCVFHRYLTLCYYSVSLCSKSKFGAVSQQSSKITSNLDSPPPILQLHNCHYHCMASHKLESPRNH